MTIQWWITERRAREMGCTHKARSLGIIPGFYGEDASLWVSRSDLLNPVEDALTWLWVQAWMLFRDDEPQFMFQVGRRIDGGEDRV